MQIGVPLVIVHTPTPRGSGHLLNLFEEYVSSNYTDSVPKLRHSFDGQYQMALAKQCPLTYWKYRRK